MEESLKNLGITDRSWCTIVWSLIELAEKQEKRIGITEDLLQAVTNNSLEREKSFKCLESKARKEFAERLKNSKEYSTERHETIVPAAVIDWTLEEMEKET